MALIVLLVVKAFSWNPGWGGRTDRKPGREVERYFGWPACFYCDLWRSDYDHEIGLAAYFPPIPLSREMNIVYHSRSVVAILLDATLVVCGTLIVMILVIAERKGRKPWMTPVGLGLAVLGFVFVIFGDEVSTHL